MEDFIYTEKFDKYLKGQLDESEKLAMEEEIQQDPLLRNEVSLQKDIFKALSEERRLLLKNRLDSVQVGTQAWFNLTGMQWAAIIGSILLVSAGSYYYFNEFEQSSSLASIDVTISEYSESALQKEDLPDIPVPEHQEVANDYSKVSPTANTVAPTDTQIENITNISEPAKQKDAVPQIVRPDILTDFAEEEQKIDYSDFEAPDKTILEKTESKAADVTVETVSDQDYIFHYKLVGQKLFLYGDFQGIPYKIIALNRDSHKMLFLNYLGNYYALEQDKSEIVPLAEIEDSTIVKALDKLSQ